MESFLHQGGMLILCNKGTQVQYERSLQKKLDRGLFTPFVLLIFARRTTDLRGLTISSRVL